MKKPDETLDNRDPEYILQSAQAVIDEGYYFHSQEAGVRYAAFFPEAHGADKPQSGGSNPSRPDTKSPVSALISDTIRPTKQEEEGPLQDGGLKTLKDFDILVTPKDAQALEIIKAYNDDLRAEAIKWVKGMQNDAHNPEVYYDNEKRALILNGSRGAINSFIKFFNLTEEDVQ